MNLAGYLCATVHVPQPSDFLSPHHNSGEMLSKDLTWAAFSNMTWHLESSDDDGNYQDDFHNTQALRTIESRIKRYTVDSIRTNCNKKAYAQDVGSGMSKEGCWYFQSSLLYHVKHIYLEEVNKMLKSLGSMFWVIALPTIVH
jgi:hypothetical protein